MVYNYMRLLSLLIVAVSVNNARVYAAVAAPVALWGPNMAVRTAQRNFKAAAPQYINPVVMAINNALTQIKGGQPIASALGAVTFSPAPVGAVATNDASLKDSGLGGPLQAALSNLVVAMQANPSAVAIAKPNIGTFVQNLVNFLPAFVVPNTDPGIAAPINTLATLAGVALPYRPVAGVVTAQTQTPVLGTVVNPQPQQMQVGTVVSVPAQAQGVVGNAQLASQAMAIIGTATNTLTAAVTAMSATTKVTNANDVLKILQALNDQSKPLGNALGTSLNMNPTDPQFPSVLTLLGTVTSLFATMDKRCYAGTKSASPTMVTSPFLDATNLQAVKQQMMTLVTKTIPAVLGLVTSAAPTNLAAIKGYTGASNQLIATVNGFKTNDAVAPMVTMAVKALALFTNRIGDRTPTLAGSSVPGISKGGITNAADLTKALTEINTTTATVLGNTLVAPMNMSSAPDLTKLFVQMDALQKALTTNTTVVKATGLSTLTQMNVIYLNPADLQAVKTGLSKLVNETIPKFVKMLVADPATIKDYPQAINKFNQYIATLQAGASQQASSSLITTATKTIDKVTGKFGSKLGISNAKNVIDAMADLNNTNNVFGCGAASGTGSATVLPEDMTAFTNSINKLLTALKNNTSNIPQGMLSSTAYLTAPQIQQVGQAVVRLGGTTIPAFMGLMIQNPKGNPYYTQIKTTINNFLAGSIFAAGGQITN